MKKELKSLTSAIRQKDIRGFLTSLKMLDKNDIEHLDEQVGLNAIHVCAQENASRELLMIITNIADINLDIKTRGIVQKTALQIALSAQNIEVAKVLIKHGAFLDNPKELKKSYKDNKDFLEIINDSLEKAVHSTKKKGFFSFG